MLATMIGPAAEPDHPHRAAIPARAAPRGNGTVRTKLAERPLQLLAKGNCHVVTMQRKMKLRWVGSIKLKEKTVCASIMGGNRPLFLRTRCEQQRITLARPAFGGPGRLGLGHVLVNTQPRRRALVRVIMTLWAWSSVMRNSASGR